MNKSLNPFWPATVGFDQLFHDLNHLINATETVAEKFPPHNIIKVDDHRYIVELAVAGFAKDDISIKRIDNILEIRGYTSQANKEIQYLHKGIGTRTFTKTIRLADTIEIRGSEFKDGILRISFENVIPKHKLPVEIEIGEGLGFDTKFGYPSTHKQLLTED